MEAHKAYPDWRIIPGIAAENYDRALNDGKLRILCPLYTPTLKGKVSVEEQDTSLSGIADEWGTSPGSVTEVNTIEAQYLGFNTNATVPDIHLGETVLVYQYGNNNKFRYWIPTGRERHIRLNEHMEMRFADEQVVLKQLSDENTYFVRFNTYKGEKCIEIGTAKSDQEEYRYRFTISPETSTATLNDMEGNNQITISSKEPFILMENRNGCKLNIFRDDIFVHAVRDLRVDAGRYIEMKAPNFNFHGDKGTFKITSLGLLSEDLVVKGAICSINSVLHAVKGMHAAAVVATGYSVSGPPPPGKPTMVDGGPAGEEGGDISVSGGGNSSVIPPAVGRHSASVEQLTVAINALAAAIDLLGPRPQVPAVAVGSFTATARSAVTSSKMPMNKGT